MTTHIEHIDNLILFANSFDRGHLKRWKAGSMLSTLNLIPEIKKDRERALKFVRNALLMEGFGDLECEEITDYLIKLV